MKQPKRISRRTMALLPFAMAGCGQLRSQGFPQAASDDAGASLPPSFMNDAQPQVPADAGIHPPGPQPNIRFDDAPHPLALRDVLYTWTTAEQIAILRQTGELFQRDERPGMGPGTLMLALAEIGITDVNQSVIDLLRGPKFAKGRYAWINPWATALGYHGEQYGEELVQLRFRPEALFARVVRNGGISRATWLQSIASLNGDEYTGPFTDAMLQRIAGVYFVNELTESLGSWTAPACSPALPGIEASYREFFFGNTAMLLECSHRTVALRTKLDTDAVKLEQLAPAPGDGNLDSSECDWLRRVIRSAWTGSPTDALSSYESSLCFLDAPYRPSTATLLNLAKTLRTRNFTPDPYIRTF
jgi:hypothetical protein